MNFRCAIRFLALSSLAWAFLAAPLVAWGQPKPASESKLKAAAEQAEQALANGPATQPAAEGEVKPLDPPDLLSLWLEKGGPLIYPIMFLSLVVVALGIERAIGLRPNKTMPWALMNGLRPLLAPGAFDPRTAYQLCQQTPSTLASVLRAALLKAGRPLPEIESTVKEIAEREATKLYKNVRTINLATTVAPLLGLLGTVLGILESFYRTANVAVGQNKSQILANGIYEALLTTVGGLVVAIPAAIIAHYFEGRIQAIMGEIQELLSTLLPQLEKLEGKVRVTRQAGEPPKPVTTGSG